MLVAWLAALTPALVAVPSSPAGAATSERGGQSAVRVTTYNISFGRTDLDRVGREITRAMRSSDVILLQEAQYDVAALLRRANVRSTVPAGWQARVIQDNRSSAYQGSTIVYNAAEVALQYREWILGTPGSSCGGRPIQNRYILRADFRVVGTTRDVVVLNAHLPPKRCATSVYQRMADQLVAQITRARTRAGEPVLVGADWNRTITGATDTTTVASRTDSVRRGQGIDGFVLGDRLLLDGSPARRLDLEFADHWATTITIGVPA